MRKNVASQNVAASMANRTTGDPLTTAVSIFFTGDGGTQTAGTGTLTHKGNGHWNYVPAQSETNFNHVVFTFTHASGVTQVVNVYTLSFDPHDTVRLGLTALPNATAGGAAGIPVVGTGANNFKSDASANVTFANTSIATVTSVTNDVGITQAGADKVWGTTTRTLTALGASLVQEIWDRATSALTTIGSIGKLLVDNVNATISSRSSHSAADVWTAGTRTLTASLDPTAGQIADAVWDEALADHLGAGSTGNKLNAIPTSGTGDWSAAEKEQIRDALGVDGTKTAAVSGQVQAIKTKTDQLVFTIANKVDAAIVAAADFAQVAADKVWASATRTLTAFGFSVTVGTNNDKTGYALTVADKDDIVDRTWDELRAGHDTALTFGNTLQTRNTTILDAVELQRGHHAATGAVFYVAPTTGNDANPGTRSLPFATIGAAQTAATAFNNDLIILLPDNVAGQTVLTESVTITKAGLQIRGPGKNFLWNVVSNVEVAVIQASNVGITGMEIRGHTVGSKAAILIDGGNNVLVEDVQVTLSQGPGLRIKNGSFCRIVSNIFFNVGQSGGAAGLEIDSTGGPSIAEWNMIQNNRIFGATGHGILHKSTSSSNTQIRDNNIKGCTGDAINIFSGTDVAVFLNHVGGNGGTITDGGTNTVLKNNEQWAKEATLATVTVAAIADGVWDELMADHLIPNTTGDTLRQARDKGPW